MGLNNRISLAADYEKHVLYASKKQNGNCDTVWAIQECAHQIWIRAAPDQTLISSLKLIDNKRPY